MSDYKLVRIFNTCYERYNARVVISSEFDIMCELDNNQEEYLKQKLTFEFLEQFFDYPDDYYVVIRYEDNIPVECCNLVTVQSMKVYIDTAEHDIRVAASVAMGVNFDIITSNH